MTCIVVIHHTKFALMWRGFIVVVVIQEGMLECLELLHFHIGSQISSILVIKEAMREASHAYCELARMGAPMVHYSLSYSIHEGLWVCLYGIQDDYNGLPTIIEILNYLVDDIEYIFSTEYHSRKCK